MFPGCAFARLLVWRGPVALPAVEASATQVTYAFRDRNWRPRRKRPHDWPASWAARMEAIRSALPQAEHVASEPLDLPPRDVRLEREVAALKGSTRA